MNYNCTSLHFPVLALPYWDHQNLSCHVTSCEYLLADSFLLTATPAQKFVVDSYSNFLLTATPAQKFINPPWI